MSGAPFRLVPLDAAHERTAFDSGSAPLDRYLRELVSQDIRRRVAACFVALDGSGRIAAYYTLASSSLWLADLPKDIGKKPPRYPTVPAIRMGRLAVDQAFKGQGLGGALLADAVVLLLVLLLLPLLLSPLKLAVLVSELVGALLTKELLFIKPCSISARFLALA